jgi:glycosyltransferase involved in cell wall biosynthesis
VNTGPASAGSPVVAGVKGWVRRHAGYWRLREAANKLLLAPTAVPLRLREEREVHRLSRLHALPASSVVTVIATYRRHGPLADAVRSALAQQVDGHLVVVVDDGGGLPALPDDPRLVAVSLSTNVGMAGVVRNIGIRLTRSTFVAFLDDDNVWEPDHLATALSVLTGPRPPDGVYTAVRRVLPSGAELDVLSVPFDRRRAADACFFDTNAFVARRCPALHFSRLRRGRRVGPREDWELMFRYSRRRTLAHVPRATVRYAVRGDSYFTDWGNVLGS